ncbi:MAG: hypothetical protein FJ265_05530 [Planctomycetes bacterium]|nr:hypothetical protein [Planctomycetota bacterium]
MLPLRHLVPPLAAALCCSPAPAQLLREGYGGQLSGFSAVTSLLLSLPGGALARFDGVDLWLDRPGLATRSLLHLHAPVSGSFLVEAAPGELLLGESSSHRLWLVPLAAPGRPRPAAAIPFAYDTALLSPGHAVVSARTGGFASPHNELLALDLATGTVQVFARLPGASGPVALATNGDLYYATASPLFPMPAGQTEVLRFPRALVDQAIAAQQLLGIAQAQVVAAGLDSAGDLAFDGEGDLLFTDWYNGAVGELRGATGPAPQRSVLIDYGAAPVGPFALQFLPSPLAGQFEPFQPPGGALCVHETAWATVSQLRTIRAARAAAGCSIPSPIPAGPFTLQVTQGPRAGLGLVAIAFGSAQGTQALRIAGFDQLLHLDGAMVAPVGAWLAPLDTMGAAAVTLHHPGTSPTLVATLQAVFVDAPGAVIGATPAVELRFGP